MKIVISVTAAALLLAVIEASAQQQQSTQRNNPRLHTMRGGSFAFSRCLNPVWFNGLFSCNYQGQPAKPKGNPAR